MDPTDRASPALLFYDGSCGLCAASVQFVLRHEPPAARSGLQFAPLEGATAQRVLAQAGGITEDSVVWVDGRAGGPPRLRTRGDAVLAIGRHLGGWWRMLAAISALVPRWVRNRVYDAIARRRLSLMARACLLPTAEERQRFLP
jgi:predicted DCC family thiol-disulfide oxidoreductase YuxK